jgi:hypothetical protein
MKITADLTKGTLVFDGAVFNISCNVRTLREGTRASHEVVRSLPDNLPYDPQRFPRGIWNVTGVEWQKERGFDYNAYGPVKIRTDAYKWVNAWRLDGDGDYCIETDQAVKDFGYLLHYSKSSTTLGCIRLASPEDAETIAGVIQRVLSQGEKVELEVI